MDKNFYINGGCFITMTEYFQRTLDVKKEILGRPDILTDLIADYEAIHEGKNRVKTFARKFDAGSTRFLFRAGQLESGIWLAHKVWLGSAAAGRLAPENDCQSAEAYFASGKHVPYFSMVVEHKGIASILTEDITQGGALKIYSDDLSYVRMQTPKGGHIIMMTDFKHVGGRIEEYTYHSEEAILHV